MNTNFEQGLEQAGKHSKSNMATMQYSYKPSETRAKTPFSKRRTTFSGRSMGDDKLELNFHQFQLCVGLCVYQLDHLSTCVHLVLCSNRHAKRVNIIATGKFSNNSSNYHKNA